jgi:hypothetical protein
MFVGAVGAKKIQHALPRILLGKVGQQHFNGLEVTGIVPKRFLGRHRVSTFTSCPAKLLPDDAEARQLSQRLAHVNGSEGYRESALVTNEF